MGSGLLSPITSAIKSDKVKTAEVKPPSAVAATPLPQQKKVQTQTQTPAAVTIAEGVTPLPQQQSVDEASKTAPVKRRPNTILTDPEDVLGG